MTKYKKNLIFKCFLFILTLLINLIFSFTSTFHAFSKNQEKNLKPTQYIIDPVHTFILFKIKHQGFSHSYGRFTDVSGEISIDEKNPDKTKINFTIQTDSLDTQHLQRDKHLKGIDFLNTKKYPTISFISTKVKLKKKNLYEIQGKLNFRGKIKTLNVLFNRLRTGRDHRGQMRTGGDTSFSIQRSEFGMKYMLNDETGIPDHVEIIASIEAIKKN